MYKPVADLPGDKVYINYTTN